MVFGPDGQLYIAARNNRILRMVDSPSSSNTAQIFANTSSEPKYLAFDQNGTLYVTLAENIVERYSSGSALSRMNFLPVINGDIDVGPDGLLTAITGDSSNGYSVMRYNTTAQSQNVVLPNAVSYWALNSSSVDSVGGNSGTGSNFFYDAGIYGNSIHFFDSTNSFLNLGSNSSLNVPGSSTWSTWFNVDYFDVQTSYLIADVASSNTTLSQGSLTLSTSNVLSWRQSTNTSSSDGSVTANAAVNNNQWYHVAVVRDDAAKTVKMYLNGTLVGASTYTGTVISAPATKKLGSAGTGVSASGFAGRMDETVFFNRALSVLEVQEIAKASGYVAATSAIQVSLNASIGTQFASFPVNSQPTSLGFAPNGRLYVRVDDLTNSQINRTIGYDWSSGSVVQTVSQPDSISGPSYMSFSPSVELSAVGVSASNAIVRGDWLVLSNSLANSSRVTLQASDLPGQFGTSKTTQLAVDFSNNSTSTIQGKLYTDANHDGIMQSTEQGVEGIVVYADSDGDSQLDSNEVFSLTDSQGNYLLTGVPQSINARIIRSQLASPGAWQSNTAPTVPGTQSVASGVNLGLVRMIQIGADLITTEGTSIPFSGLIQPLSSGLAMEYRWEVRKNGVLLSSGPSGVGNGPIQTNFTFTPSDNGIFEVSLYASLASNPATILFRDSTQVTVGNVAPQNLQISGAPVSPLEGQLIQLTASFSDPGTGDQFNYAWNVTRNGQAVAGLVLNQSTLQFTPDDQSVYVVKLTVTDDDGASSIATPITLNVGNVAPVVSVIGAPSSAIEGGIISLTGGVTDIDYNDLYPDRKAQFSFQWTVTRNGLPYPVANALTKDLVFSPNDEGTYVVSFIATDNSNATSSPPASRRYQC
ncbi:MAG: LamG-like jellyroll fold domain-containing protein [Pirellulales bacterium]